MPHRTGSEAENAFSHRRCSFHALPFHWLLCAAQSAVEARSGSPTTVRSIHCPCLRVPRVDVHGSYRMRPREIRKVVRNPCKNSQFAANGCPSRSRLADAAMTSWLIAGGTAVTERPIAGGKGLRISGAVQGVGFRAETQQPGARAGPPGMGAQRTRRDGRGARRGPPRGRRSAARVPAEGPPGAGGRAGRATRCASRGTSSSRSAG